MGDMALVKFLSLLENKGLIKKEDITILKNKYSNTEDMYSGLLSLANLDDSVLSRIYAETKGIPYIDLQSIDEDALGLVDQDVALKFGFIPFFIDHTNRSLQVAITDPSKFKMLNPRALKALEEKLELKIELFVSSSKNALNLLKNKQNDGTLAENIIDSPIDLNKIEIKGSVLKKIPYDIAKKYSVISFQKSPDNTLEVAAVNPADPKLQEMLTYVQKETGVKMKIFEASQEQIDEVLETYQDKVDKSSENEAMDEMRAPVSEPGLDEERTVTQDSSQKKKPDEPESLDLSSILGREDIAVVDLKGYANTGQVPQLLASMIVLAFKQRASDIHIEPFEKAVRVRYRIDGELTDIILLPANMISHIIARIKILSKLKLDEQRIPQDGRMDAKIGKEVLDIRVSTLPTVFGEKAALRLLSKSRKMEKLEDLGFDGLNYDRTIEALTKPFGVVLSTGPTGSGKTTSLYSMLYRLNRPEVNIVTLEDPVEYEIAGINQTQIKPQIGFGFADGLRSILRQDPNVIMVGEIRDSDTAELVIQAALTGHMVLSTLHTNDASSALARLYDLGVEPFLLTSALDIVIGQRLVRRICSKCKVEVEMPQSVMFEVKKEFEKLNFNQPMKFYKGKGCDSCKDGFVGRIGIFEVLAMSDAIEALVLAKKTSGEIFTQAVKEGMITMKQDGLIKAVKGVTTVDEVLRVTAQIKEG